MHAPSFFYLETLAWISLAFFYFRLDYLIGLKIMFDIRHINARENLIVRTVRLKNALCRFSIYISFEKTAYKVVLKIQTLWAMYT